MYIWFFGYFPVAICVKKKMGRHKVNRGRRREAYQTREENKIHDPEQDRTT